MINLFTASAANNYAKTCHLYLQPIEVLEKDHPHIFEQFVIGNHTVRRTNVHFDLPFKQILMKSLKGRGRVIGKGMTENMLNVWTNTIPKGADVVTLI